MSVLIKTPFRSNMLETDPYVYGLRPNIIRNCIVELFNNKSVLITGTRGIGKSSLGYQLQRILDGDNTVLRRCGFDIALGNYITVSYLCTPQDTLETIVCGIIEQLNKKLNEKITKFTVKETSLEVSLLGVLKGGIKIGKENTSTYNSLVNNFVVLMKQFSEAYVEPHINIVIDELDQISESENIAHFIKAIIEKLTALEENFLSFILVGQEILYQRLYNQQPAFHRLVKHIQLYPLNEENTEFVFDACLGRSSIPIQIDQDAKNLLLNLTGGYPAIIQLLGHETFTCCLEKYFNMPKYINIGVSDVLGGIKNAIISEKVRFDTILSQLTDDEKGCILTMADTSQKQVPFTYEFTHVLDGLAMKNSEEKMNLAQRILESLVNRQVLIFLKEEIDVNILKKKFRFREELFRIYLYDRMHNKEALDYD